MKKDIYSTLEKTMVRYRDLKTVPVTDVGESFVALDPSVIPNAYFPAMSDMEKITGPTIVVRKSVAEKLNKAQDMLQQTYPSLSLFVTYGYRSLEVQTERFLWKLADIAKQTFFSNPISLYEEVHRFIAVPTVAGHPTGGAVDVGLCEKNTNTFLNFGSTMYDYSTKDCYVNAPISRAAKKNRMLLRQYMIKAGFAPFDGEWWHFSWGDREWTFYYKRPVALYSQIPVGKLNIISYNKEEP